MFRTIATLAIVIGYAAAADAAETSGLVWAPDVDTARREAQATNRLVLLHFGANWCAPCKQLERNVFSQPSFGQELGASYVGVKVNYDIERDLAARLGIDRIPTDVVITPDGRVVQKFTSPDTSAKYSATLSQIAANTRSAASAAQSQLAAEKAVVQSMQSPAIAANANDRYADILNNAPSQAGAAQSSATPATSTQSSDSLAARTADSLGDRYANILSPTTASAATSGSGDSSQVAAGSGFADQPAFSQNTQNTLAPQANNVASANPAPFGLDGFCPVTLVHDKAWRAGDTRWGAVHRGRTYLFSSAQAQQEFLKSPDMYAPALGGDDPVVALDEGRTAAGQRALGVTYERRIFLFSSQNSLDKFCADPGRYAAEYSQVRR